MNAPSPFATACERLDDLVANTANLPSTIHLMEIAADRLEADPGYLPTLNLVTRLQAETALMICTTELKKPHPCLDAAFDMADRALNLIGLMRIEDAAAQRAAGRKP
jgi:hypothetical protein